MRGGEKLPELGIILRSIADRLQRGETDLSQNIQDAEALRYIAASFDGESAFELRMHRKRGGQPKILAGMEERLEAAKTVLKHCEENECSIAEAAAELDGLNMLGDESLQNAAHEFGPILRLPRAERELMLFMKRQETLGRVTITKGK